MKRKANHFPALKNVISTAICFLSVSLAHSVSAQQVSIKVRPVFDGLPVSMNQASMYVELENRGGDLEGEIVQEGNSDEGVSYPVSLPSGSKKRIYYLAPSYFSGTVIFRSGFREFRASARSDYPSSSSSRFVLIGNNPNDLIFLKNDRLSSRSNEEVQNMILTGGSLPEDAPDRDSAYSDIDVVVLGEGSERLEKRQIETLRRFVISGGTLAFVGGAATSALKDPRWIDLVPILNPQVQTINGVTVTAGLPKPGSKTAALPFGKSISRTYGFGRTLLFTADPFEEPFKSASDRRTSIYKSMVRSSMASLRKGVNAEFGLSDGYSSPSFGGIPVSSSTLGTDAFGITAPSSNSVFMVLVFYIIFVIPVNFLILRRFKKLEWAWITVPIISIIFSLIFLRTTVSLYSAAATTKTNSVAFVDGSGRQESVLVYGKSEMFFPTAGRYDLKLKEVDSIGSQRSLRSKLEFIDTGSEVMAPGIEASNLNFREFSFAQRRTELSGIQCSYNPKSLQVRVKNLSKLTFSQCSLYPANGTQMNSSKQQLKPGEETIFKLNPADLKTGGGIQQSDSVQSAVLLSIRSSEIPMFVRLATQDLRIGADHGTVHPLSLLSVIVRPTLETN